MRHLALSILRRLTQDTRQVYQHANMSTNRIAVCQMTSVADKAANLKVVGDLISDAAKENVQMIFFPEACDFICDNKKDVINFAEPLLTGATVGKYRELAAKHNVWLSMGGVHEKDENNPTKMFNTHIIINNKGEIVQTYRKLHLFDVEIPEKNVRLKESDFTESGSHIVAPVDTPVGKIGMAICYDMRFPELSTALSILSAEILTFPSAFTQATGAVHWHILLRSRAIETQCFVVAAAQTGQHNAKRKSYGHALCVDPWGEVLADCGEEVGYKIAELSGDRLTEVRRNMPVFQHRRRDVYSLHALSLRKTLLPEHGYTPAASTENRTPDPTDSGPSYVFGHVRVPETCVFFKSKLTYAFVNLSNEFEQTAHHILWECELWYAERQTMLDSIKSFSGVPYYMDLVATRDYFRAFRCFCHTDYWKQNRCVIPGHVLVAPIREIERNNDLTSEEANDFYKTVRLVQKLMERVHKAQSCTVTIQDGPEAGQTVKHLHCHIMPRKRGDFIENDLIYLELAKHDQFKSGHPCKPPRTRQEMDEEAALLRKEIEILLQEEKSSQS